MSRENKPKPTVAELEILSILWQRDSATVREVYEVINSQRPTVYTTVLKMLQIMTDKGLVERDTTSRTHVYRAKIKREETERQFTKELLQRIFRGSASQLVLRVLETEPANDAELAEIRNMLDEAQKRDKK